MHRILAVMLAVLLSLAASSASAGVIHRPERHVIRGTNYSRVLHHLPRLDPGPRLRRAAERQARAMANQRALFHGHLRFAPHACWGQNVGVGPNVKAVLRAFRHSPEHRRILLDPRYQRIGVGVVRRGGVVWVAVDFAE